MSSRAVRPARWPSTKRREMRSIWKSGHVTRAACVSRNVRPMKCTNWKIANAPFVNRWVCSKPIDIEPSHWVLPPGHWRLKLKICRLFHANMCKFDAEIKSYKDGETIWIYHNHYLLFMYVQQQTLPLCVQLLLNYDRAVHISVAVDMRTLLDRKNFSSSSNGQVAAHRVTGLIINRLWCVLDVII